MADLCAAPGGKTGQLIAAGADVTAVDRDAGRMERLAGNLARWGLKANLVTADILDWQPTELFDAILLDAPCSATGTIRRHPDAMRLKRPRDVQSMAEAQDRLIAAAATMLRPGGRMIYSVCSLQPEEGAPRIGAAVARRILRSDPFMPAELAAIPQARSPDGYLITNPSIWSERGGMDGFFAARLVRT